MPVCGLAVGGAGGARGRLLGRRWAHLRGACTPLVPGCVTPTTERKMMDDQLLQGRRNICEFCFCRRIHAEFCHFSSLEIFSLFEQYVVRNADSLGMNEVELQLMLDYWAGKVTDINDENSSEIGLE